VHLIQIDHNPSQRQLSVFGAAWLLFFGIAAGIVFYRGGPTAVAATLCVLAIGVPGIGWCLPAFMRAAYLTMAYVALPIGWVISHLVLALAYYAVLTPIGLVLRLFNHDPMQRRFDPEAEAYWYPRKQDEDVERYFKQF